MTEELQYYAENVSDVESIEYDPYASSDDSRDADYENDLSETEEEKENIEEDVEQYEEKAVLKMK